MYDPADLHSLFWSKLWTFKIQFSTNLQFLYIFNPSSECSSPPHKSYEHRGSLKKNQISVYTPAPIIWQKGEAREMIHFKTFFSWVRSRSVQLQQTRGMEQQTWALWIRHLLAPPTSTTDASCIRSSHGSASPDASSTFDINLTSSLSSFLWANWRQHFFPPTALQCRLGQFHLNRKPVDSVIKCTYLTHFFCSSIAKDRLLC